MSIQYHAVTNGSSISSHSALSLNTKSPYTNKTNHTQAGAITVKLLRRPPSGKGNKPQSVTPRDSATNSRYRRSTCSVPPGARVSGRPIRIVRCWGFHYMHTGLQLPVGGELFMGDEAG